MILRADHPGYFNPAPINGERFVKMDILGKTYLFSDHGRLINQERQVVLTPQLECESGKFFITRGRGEDRKSAGISIRAALKRQFGIDVPRRSPTFNNLKADIEREYLPDNFTVKTGRQEFVYF